MGMTIEDARTALGKERKYALHENKQAFDIAIDTMRKYQQLQADYETRLRADLKAILVELQLEIEEQRQDNPEFNIWKDGYNTANDIDCVIIQQKINSLKED